MGVKLLPNIMSSIGYKQDYCCPKSSDLAFFSAMFGIVRNTPTLFQYIDSSVSNQNVSDIIDQLEQIGIGPSMPV